MSRNRGHEYEWLVYNHLVSVNGRYVKDVPAGNLNRPDLLISNGKKVFSGCELKISPKASGSITFNYTKKGWQLNLTKTSSPETVFLHNIAKEIDLLSIVRKDWLGKPLRSIPVDPRTLRMTKKAIYESDHRKFPDIYVHTIKPIVISRYYNIKETYYMNVGTHGFYLLGGKDPLGLNARLSQHGMPPIPKFELFLENVKGRARVQYKGHDKNHEFTFSLVMGKLKPSIYNLAGVKNPSSVVLDPSKTCLPFGPK